MPVKQFADTSAVSIAYAIDAAANAGELVATEFTYVPYTSESFQMSKEAKKSTAISNDRRPGGSKNTRGTASGSIATEFGYVPFIIDMLQLAMMSTWQDETAASVPTGAKFILDGEDRQLFVAEKRIKNTVGGVKTNFLERYFGNLVNEASLEIGNSELISFSVNTTAAFADTASADASADGDAGGMAATYTVPAAYEIADATNNIANIVLKDDLGSPIEVVWSDATLSITNNVREQAGVGNEFAAGLAMGKVNVSLSGTIYYYDDSVLKAHLDNKVMSAEITITTAEGSFVIHLPRLKAESPGANAQGENQDYTQSLTLTAERGQLTISEATQTCVIAIVHDAV